MGRLFLKNQQYHKILPESLYEGQFEGRITLQAPELYPDYHVIPFKKTVSSPKGNATPDLAFIAKDYRNWYVVEVEMAYHSFDSHVEPQIDRLRNANYDDDHVIDHLCKTKPELDRMRISELIHNEPVKILLILNEPRDKWAKDLKNRYGVVTSVFEVYHLAFPEQRVALPSEMYGVSGSYPVYSVSEITPCSIHPMLPYLGIEDNSILNLKHNDQITLEYKNCITFWKATQGPHDSIWLQIQGRNEILNRRKKYRITKLRNGSLLLDIT